MIRILIPLIISYLLVACTNSESPRDTLSGETHTGTYRSALDPDERIALAKKRKSYISGIRKGDFYSLRNAPEEALSYYLSIAEKIPNDQVVRKKIAHVYFMLKDWTKSYKEYSQVPIGELRDDEKSELFQALFFDKNRINRLDELNRYVISTGALEYYTIVDACYGGIHNCIASLESYTGSYELVLSLKKQIKNAKKITDAPEYRDLLIATKLYEQSMYRASAKILEEVLRRLPDYIEAKKILGFSYFELGDYEDSKKMLLSYLEKVPNDIESIVRMGEIQYYLGDYVGSNLYLNNAILSGYTPKINLERRLAHNYYLLGDMVGMIKVLSYLVQEVDATEDDFAVAISTALSEGDFTRASSWADIGMSKFPSSHMLGALSLRVKRESGDIDGVERILAGLDDTTLRLNPNYLLEKGIFLYEREDYIQARKIFEEISRMDGWEDLSSEASIYLSRMNNQESSTSNTSWW